MIISQQKNFIEINGLRIEHYLYASVYGVSSVKPCPLPYAYGLLFLHPFLLTTCYEKVP